MTKCFLSILVCCLFSCCLLAGNTEAVSGEYAYYRNKAIESISKLEASNNFTDELSISDLNNLPMGLSRTISNVKYTIAISAFRLHADYAELTVYAQVKIPQSKDGEPQDKLLYFGAQGIKLSHDGSIIGDARLTLLGDINIPIHGDRAMLVLRGMLDQSTGQGMDLTYLSMDCKGFKELGITADVVFPEELLRSVDENGEPLTGVNSKNEPLSRVTASFRTIVRDWSDILVSIDLPRFEINGLNGFIFDVRKAVFDFSDFRNDPGIQYPSDYQSKYLIPGNPSLWKGVYIQELSITLPKQFANKESDKRISFAAQHMILDNNGVSGLFSANNVLSIDQGSAGGWRFSVDNFSIELEANQLMGAGFAGLIGLPVSESSTLAYDAFISPDNEYYLKVNPAKSINFDVWAAKAEILPNSYVELKVIDDKFYPEAMLNGSLSIALRNKPGDTTSNSIAQLHGINFTGLHLKTQSPYFLVKNLGYSGEIKLMNFPLSISQIELKTSGNESRLGFEANLSLGDVNSPIGAKTRLEVVGLMVENKGMQSWKYEKFDLSGIRLDVTLGGAFRLSGGLSLLNDDPIYGNGFSGDMTLEIKEGLKLTVASRAIFGYKDYRYWFLDGLTKFSPGITVFPPAVNLTGFAGGAYYRMKPSGYNPGAFTENTYVPDENYGLGLKAAIMFSIGAKSIAKGEASFEIAFNKHGGLNFIGLYGYAVVLGDIPGTDKMDKLLSEKFRGIAEKEAAFTKNNPTLIGALEKMKMYDPNKAALNIFENSQPLGGSGFTAAMGIQYDFTKKSLHSTFELYINMLGGMLRGSSSANKAGWATLHIEPGEWYMHMGTPDNRLGVSFNLAGLVRMESGSYFMMGDRIPGSPPPPVEVTRILGANADKLNYMRDLNALGDGRGLAFGTDFKVSTGDITFLILYANFATGLGFDIMLKDYGDAQCKGRSGPIGMNGWYANGQAYAFLQGELGVKINLLFIKKKIPVIRGAAATLMQAKLPNPAWFAGYLGVQFDLLGGLVRGNMRLKLQFGEECELLIPGGSPLGVKVISDINPADKSDKIDVFTAPQAAFNMPIDKVFEMEDDQGVKKYKLNLEEFSVLHNGKALAGKVTWNSNKDAASFYSHEILPPNVPLTALVRITFEEYTDGQWKKTYTAGKLAEERMEVSFTTGTAPDVIPLHNIEYCYPVIGQKFFYPKESSKAYVQLKRGQNYLFDSDKKHEIQISNTSGQTSRIPFAYNAGSRRIEYNMAALSTATAYTVDMITFSGSVSAGTGTNTPQRISVGDDENEITVKDAKAANVISTTGKSLLSYNFSTSKHLTFVDKINAIRKDYAFADKLASDIINLQYRITEGEPFDVAELTGTPYSGNIPLVHASAVLDDYYYKNLIHPLVYDSYSSLGFTISNRQTDIYGVPPARAVTVNTAYLTQVENGNFGVLAKSHFPYIYNLALVYKYDYLDLRGQIVNRYPTPPNSRLERFYTGGYPFIVYGHYKTNLQYRLPGESSGKQTGFEFYNFIK